MYRRLSLSVLGLVAFACFLAAQNDRISELKIALKQVEDTARVKTLAALGFEYAFIDSDTSRQYSRQAISLGRRLEFPKGEADAVNNLAISFDIIGEYDSSLFYFLEALRIYETIDHKPGIARALSNCGMVFQNLDSSQKSLNYHLRSFNMEKQLEDSIGMAYSMIHIANLFTDLERSDSALFYYEQSIQILERKGDRDGLTYSYVGLGEYYRETEPQKAIKYLLKAEEIYQEFGNSTGLANAGLLLGMAYQNANTRDVSALQSYKKALKQAEMVGAMQVKAQILSRMADWYELNSQPQAALDHFRQFKTIEDSVFSEEKARQIASIEGAFLSEKKDNEIFLLNAENKQQKQLTYYLVIGVLVVLSLLGMLWLNYLSRSKAYALLKRTNQQIETKNREVEMERNNATQATRAKANFLSVMSHEIRTPLNAIIGLTHLLIDYPEQGDKKKNLSSLKFSAENLLALINDILDYSKLEEGKAEIESIQFNLKETLDRILDSFLFKAEEKQIRLKAKYDSAMPSIVTGDPTRFSQVLNNLLSNAIKFTDTGSVTLDAEVIDHGLIQFSVIDTGIGIMADKLDAIFESFTQADEGVNRKFGGTGLGLAIAKQLVEAMGASLQVESVEGKGTRFFFTLPLEASSAATYANRAVGKRPSFTSMKGARVLLMEDNAVNVLVATQFLKSWSVDVDVASNGVEGLQLMEQDRYDLILMDLEMPVMDGFETTEHIRKNLNEANKHIPVIAITSSTSIMARNKARAAGMNDFITKPFNPNELYKMLEKFVLKLDAEEVSENQD
ncbi:MAG: response regulator [Roseivirga sp.]|nr:response regulator [Roseivirga sp.]